MASSSSRPVGSSTLPTDKPLALPPLDPPPLTKGGSTPIVYTVKLSNDVVDALLSAPNPSIRFDSESNGVLCIPNANDEIRFNARPVNGTDSETAHAACLSRRGDSLRTVGAIVAHLDLDHQLSKSISSGPRKRTLPLTNTNKREVKIIDDDYTQSAKRPRVRKPAIEKRPRPGPRRSLNSQPPKPQSQPHPLTSTPKPSITSKPLTKPSSQQHISPPSFSPVPPQTAGKSINPPSSLRGPLRSAPSTIRSPVSPNISPTARTPNAAGALPRPLSGQTSGSSLPFIKRSVPLPSNGSTNMTNNGSSQPGANLNTVANSLFGAQRAATNGNGGAGASNTSAVPNGMVGKGKTQPRSSFSGLKPRTVSPVTANPPVLPHPPRRPGHPISPHGSRGPSPMNGYYTGAVTSPRPSGSIRPEQREEMRRHVIHMLAATERHMSSLKSALMIDDNRPELINLLSGIVKEVGEKRSDLIYLKRQYWREVSDLYKAYNDVEREKVRKARSQMVTPSAKDDGKAGIGMEGVADEDESSDIMAYEKLEERLDVFEKEEDETKVPKVASVKDEIELRKRFTKWYPVYSAMVGRMENMKKLFVTLEKRFLDCGSNRDRDGVVKEIHRSHQKLRGRKQRLERTLPVMHALLKDIKKALNKHANDGA